MKNVNKKYSPSRSAKNKEKQGRKHGFTLIEVIIAMFIFVVVISGSTVVFASTFKSYGKAKDMQENMENAQYAMNLMAKTLRTSSVAGENFGSVTVFDYSQKTCIKYDFGGSELMRYVDDGSVSDLSGCESFSFSDPGTPMTSGIVTGRFYVTESDDTAGSEEVGKITVFMKVSNGDDEVDMQTTTSLRDYVESGITL